MQQNINDQEKGKKMGYDKLHKIGKINDNRNELD